MRKLLLKIKRFFKRILGMTYKIKDDAESLDAAVSNFIEQLIQFIEFENQRPYNGQFRNIDQNIVDVLLNSMDRSAIQPPNSLIKFNIGNNEFVLSKLPTISRKVLIYTYAPMVDFNSPQNNNIKHEIIWELTIQFSMSKGNIITTINGIPYGGEQTLLKDYINAIFKSFNYPFETI